MTKDRTPERRAVNTPCAPRASPGRVSSASISEGKRRVRQSLARGLRLFSRHRSTLQVGDGSKMGLTVRFPLIRGGSNCRHFRKHLIPCN